MSIAAQCYLARMRLASTLLLLAALSVPTVLPAAPRVPGTYPTPHWALPFHQRYRCTLRLLALAGVVTGAAWAGGAFRVTRPDEPVPSHPVPEDAAQPPQQFPPPDFRNQVPDLP